MEVDPKAEQLRRQRVRAEMDKNSSLGERAAEAIVDQKVPTPIRAIDLRIAPSPRISGSLMISDPIDDDAPRQPSCPNCDGAGFYKEAVPLGHPNFGRLQTCECLQLSRQQDAAARTANLLGTLREELGRLARCTFANFALARPLRDDVEWNGGWYSPAKQRTILRAALDQSQRFAQRRRDRGWLYFQGPYGSGKSHLSAAIANDLAGKGHTVSYASAPALLRFVRQGMKDKTADTRIEALQQVDLLIIDDLGTENDGDWATEVFFDLINIRYLADRSTIFTSNLSLRQIASRIGSRIAELAMIIPVIAGDHRVLARISHTTLDEEEEDS